MLRWIRRLLVLLLLLALAAALLAWWLLRASLPTLDGERAPALAGLAALYGVADLLPAAAA